jgi:hypothetical protein
MALNLNALSYPFDPTGSLASNLITGEQQILTAVNWTDYQFLVPRWAPFFPDSAVLTITDTQGTTRPLVPYVDWYPCFEFISASKACATPIWGGIQLINPLLTGVVNMQYQTLGGIWTLDEVAIAALLADRLANPRITAWEQVVDQPVMFPVIDHEWDLVDLVGASDIVTALGGIEDMLRNTGTTGLAAHLADFTNPHRVTAAQTGLGLVQNYGIAQLADLTTGTSTTTYVTPGGVTTMINAGVGASLTAYMARRDNPNVVTAAQVGAYSTSQVDTMLAGFLSTGGTAADATLFDGMDSTSYRDWALSTGVAANSLEFGGQTPAQFTASVLTGKSADSTLFNGQTLAQVSTAVLLGKAADSALFNGQTPADFTTSVLGGTAANSDMLGGETYAQVISDALAGKSADTFEFNGMTPDQFATWVMQNYSAINSTELNNMTAAELAVWILDANGPASDSTLFAGNTLQQVIAQAGQSLGTAFAAQVLYDPTSGEVGTDYWTELGQMALPIGTGSEITGYNDIQWMVSGGDSNNELTSGMYYLNINARGTSPNQVTLNVTNLLKTDPGAQFGYTVETLTLNGQAVPTIRVWMHTGPNQNAFTVTRLAEDSSRLVAGSRVAVAPASIVYAVTDRFALESEVTAVLESLTTSFNALASQISGS